MYIYVTLLGKKRNAGVPLPLVAELSAAKRNFMMITEWKLALQSHVAYMTTSKLQAATAVTNCNLNLAFARATQLHLSAACVCVLITSHNYL